MNDGNDLSNDLPARIDRAPTAKPTHNPLKTPRSIRLLRLDIITPKPGYSIADGWTLDQVDIITSNEQVKNIENIYLMPRVETFELDSCPPYLALSYTWGDPIRRDLNGNEDASRQPHQMTRYNFGSGFFNIPLSLNHAINQLAVSEAYRCRWLWMDAICIDRVGHEPYQTKRLQSV
ncbi:hypothetical protein AOQ84DRAFT_383406 [Glonium stellatum]|uniref:Heterokaryon incompatibility domain-containing protein n=1 Tax=Glonium stellatum TaxID=574774 RepID=A0A8E2EN26_9PEZI|nr:hypothetical protein AOQ84DRAFT_383406 [Glonium stellatum]